MACDGNIKFPKNLLYFSRAVIQGNESEFHQSLQLFNKSFCDMIGKETTGVGFTVMTHALLIR